jgi:hypothetical protein
MRRTDLFIGICMAILLTSAGLKAQQANGRTTGQAVTMNRLITFNGTLKDSNGQPQVGIVGITFSIYTLQEGGDPLWRESQTVQTDEQGRYTVLLGATEKEGLPLEVFSNGRAQWLGVEMQGQKEQARVLLWAVPYALKAADADTVGGKPLSSFVLYEDLSKIIERQSAPIVLATSAAILGSNAPKSLTLDGSSGRASQGAQVQASGGTIGPFYGNETGSNTWYGQAAGASITTGTSDSFFGYSAGSNTTAGNSNSFFGYVAGASNTGTGGNSFFGAYAGQYNTGNFNSFFGNGAGNHASAAGNNSFFGYGAGQGTSGPSNSFFGSGAGWNNTTGGNNSFFGYQAGFSNTASGNTFFGTSAGYANTSGSQNGFFGYEAGMANSTGIYNSFLGYQAGNSNTIESNNSFIGARSNGAAGITNATAIGYQAQVTRSNSLVLGGVNGFNGANAETNVGIGTTSPDRQLTVEGTQALGRFRRFYGTADPFTATYAPAFLFERARGTQAAPSDILAGDYLGKVQFAGRVGGSYPGYGALAFIASDTAQNGRFAFLDRDIATERVSILNTGNVGIGTTAPTERLHVVGNIRVTGTITYGAPETDIPDYVFDPNYQLMTPEDLGKFVAHEKHLPNVPAASEVKEKGLNLSEFQMKLLEKIEELTIYTVQQAKTIQTQQITIKDHKNALERKDAEMAALKSQNSTLDARVAALEQMMERLLRQDNR